MDAIKGYSSDEDNCIEEEPELNVQTRPAFDFFNITDTVDKSCNSTIPQSNNTLTTVHLQNSKSIDGVDVEIPNSSFWSNVKWDDVTVLDHPSNVMQNVQTSAVSTRPSDSIVPLALEWKRYKPERNKETKLTLNDVSQLKDQQMIINKNPVISVGSGSHNKLCKRMGDNVETIGNYDSKTKRKRQIDEQLNDSSTFDTSIQSNRKLFYIHSKIRNHLSGPKLKKKVPAHMEKEITAHNSPVNRVKWNISEYSHLFLSSSMDRSIKIWNCWTDLEYCVQTLSCHSRAVKDADWSICGKQVLSCSFDKTAALTDVETGERITTFGHQSFVNCGKFHPETAHLVLTGCRNFMYLWDERSPQKPQREYVYKDKLGQVVDLIFSSDGTEIFCCCDEISRDSADRNIMAWDFSSGVALSNQIYQERYSCTRLKLHPTEGNFLAQSQGGYIAIFSVNRPYKMTKVKRFDGHKVSGYSIGFDILRDGSSVISASTDGKLYCYNYYNGQCFRKLDTGLDVCLDVAVHPVLPSTLVCCGWNGNIQLWR